MPVAGVFRTFLPADQIKKGSYKVPQFCLCSKCPKQTCACFYLYMQCPPSALDPVEARARMQIGRSSHFPALSSNPSNPWPAGIADIPVYTACASRVPLERHQMPRTEDAAAVSDGSNATLCGNCFKVLQKPLVCDRCKTATYRSKDCQVHTNSTQKTGLPCKKGCHGQTTNAHTNRMCLTE